MAVSLTQVQAPLSGLPNGGAQGQLTLNVLNKTDFLIAQLKALDATRVHRVEVVKALVNGRAEVQVGGLRLDVKASLPLKAGESFQLKFEQVGSALRFVQPLRPDGAAQKVLAKTGATAQPDTEKPALAKPAPPLKGAEKPSGPLGQPPPARSPQGHAAQPRPPLSHSAGQPQAHGTPPPAGRALATNTTLLPNKTPASHKTLAPHKIPAHSAPPTPPGARGLGGAVQITGHGGGHAKAQALATGGLGQPLSPIPGPVAPTALLRAAATLLPALQEGASLQKQSTHTPGRPAAPPDQGATRSPSANLPKGGHPPLADQGAAALDQAMANKTSKASEVSARYQSLASSHGEPVSEGRVAALRPADVTLALPFTSERPFMVGFYLEDDQVAAAPGEQGRGYGLRFHFESQTVGSIFADMALIAGQLRLSLWAGRAAMAEKLSQQQAALKERLEAGGLTVAALSVRQGEGPIALMQSVAFHVDEEI